MSYCDENGCVNRKRNLVGEPIEMTNNKQSSVDSIIEFCHKQMDKDTSIHKGVYLSIIKFCEEQVKAMHKDEMIEFARNYMRQLYDKGVITVETFYNETFGGDNEQ
jgi:hypothetical protein